MEEHQKSKYRYERKYVFHQTKYFNLISQLYKKGFYKIHDSRVVNNIYLDDWNFSSVIDNIDGISDRKKHRIRWYGNPFALSEKFYEQKIKNGFIGVKELNSLGIFKLDSIQSVHDMYNKELANQFKIDLQPKLYNSYRRKYFSNSKQKIRITVDSELFFYSPITKLTFNDFKTIVEIKYDRYHPFLNEFKNYNMTKYSKYVKGITQTTFYLPNYSS